MKKLVWWVLFFLCTPLMAENAKQITFVITGVSGKVQANIEKRLNELHQLKPVDELNQDELSTQVIQAIQPFGFFKATVSIQKIDAQKLAINIKTGPQVRISSLQIILEDEGRLNPSLLIAVKKVPLHVGDPLFSELYNQTKQKLLNSAEDLGYLHAHYQKAEVLVNEDTNTAQITLILNTGSMYYFGQVHFDPTNINPDLLHRFVPFHPGQPYSTNQMLKLNDYLNQSGYFNSVLVKPEISNETTVPINVHLQPVSKYSYTLSAGYGTDTGVRGRAGLNVIPVNRRGHKFNAMAQGSFTQNALQAQYVIPGTNPMTDQYSITGNYSNLNYNTGYGNAYLLSLAQQHTTPFFKRNLSLNGLYERFHYSLQPTTNQFDLYPKAQFIFSKTSNILFSPTGYNISINALAANKRALSNLDFGQVSLDAKAAIMLEPLRLRLYGHTIQGITATDDINQLPLSLALLLGGADNLKGYSFNSIGPGKTITYGGFELQKEIKKNWYLIGFYDAGDVYNPVARNIKYDAGAALMWVSPIGPIKAGLAQPINNRFQREGASPRLVISMGSDL